MKAVCLQCWKPNTLKLPGLRRYIEQICKEQVILDMWTSKMYDLFIHDTKVSDYEMKFALLDDVIPSSYGLS